MLISKSQDEIVRLELVAQANVQGVSRRIPILRGPIKLCIHLILHVRGDRINVGTLAERIVVTDAHNITLEIKVGIGISILKSILNAVSSFGIDIAYTEHGFAAGDGGVCSQADAVALNFDQCTNGDVGEELVEFAQVDVTHSRLGDAADRGQLHFIEVLSTEVNLGYFKVPTAA